MDNDALFEAMLLDPAADADLLCDIATIVERVKRVATGEEVTTSPDDTWQRAVPSADSAEQPCGADVVRLGHDIVLSGLTVAQERLSVPRIIGGGAK